MGSRWGPWVSVPAGALFFSGVARAATSFLFFAITHANGHAGGGDEVDRQRSGHVTALGFKPNRRGAFSYETRPHRHGHFAL